MAKKRVYEPTMIVDKFTGLKSTQDRQHIEDGDFTTALNIIFDYDGKPVNREGIYPRRIGRPLSHLGTSVDNVCGMYYLGMFTANSDYSSIFLGISNNNGQPVFPYRMFMIGSDTDINPFANLFTSPATTDPEDKRCAVSEGAMFVQGITPYLFTIDGYRYNDAGKTTWDTPWTDAEEQYFEGTMCTHKDRLFLARRDSSRLYFSAPGDAENYEDPEGGSFDVDPGTGDRINKIVSFKDNIYVFKRDSMWILYTNGIPAQWSLRKVLDIGCFGHTPTVVDGYIYWVHSTGAYSFDGQGTIRISDPIQDVFDALDLVDGSIGNIDLAIPYVPHTYGAYYKNNWIFNLVTRSNNHQIYCFNTKHRTWSRWLFNNFNQNSKILSMWSIRDVPRSLDFSYGGSGIFKNDTVEGFYFTLYNPNNSIPAVYKMGKFPFPGLWNESYNAIGYGLDWEIISTGTFDEDTSNGTTLNIDAVDYEVPDTEVEDSYVKILLEGSLPWPIADPTTSRAGQSRDVQSISNSVLNTSSVVFVNPTFFSYGPSNWQGESSIIFALLKPTPVEVIIVTRAWDFERPYEFKKFKRAFAELTANDVTLSVLVDGQNILPGPTVSISKEIALSTSILNPQQAVIPIASNFRGQNISFRIIPNTLGYKFKLYSIGTSVVLASEIGENSVRADFSRNKFRNL